MKQILLPAMAVALLLVSCTQPAEKQAVFTAPTIVNDTSTVTLVRNLEMEVRSVNGQTVIDVEKDGVKETITMADWEANKKMYEEKYGVLPPPPPPVPQSTVLIEDVGFTPPTIVKDENIKMNVRYKNGQTTIEVEKNGVKESVKMADWEANKGMYEKKYGKLPPPPPPPPPAAPKPPPPPVKS